MKMRLTTPVAAPGAWLIAGRSAAGVVLLVVAVSACTGGGGSGSSVPSIFTPTARPTSGHSSVSSTPYPVAGRRRLIHREGGREHVADGAPEQSRTRTRRLPRHRSRRRRPLRRPPRRRTRRAPVTHTSAPVATLYPTAAPETGGGGAAGLQDGLLFGIGGLAVFAGLGSLAYRRRLARKFGAGQRTPQTPADREPADH